QLRERGYVHVNVIVEQSDAAANYGAAIEQWKKSKANARCKIVFACDVVTVITHAIINSQPAIHGPGVFEETQELCLVTAQFSTAGKVELLAARSVGPQNAHRVTRVASIKSDVVNAAADFHEMFAGKLRWRETVDLERLVAFAPPCLLVEKVSRVHVRRKVHRLSARARKDVGVELLDAE